jgi:hypothetical protein
VLKRSVAQERVAFGTIRFLSILTIAILALNLTVQIVLKRSVAAVEGGAGA